MCVSGERGPKASERNVLLRKGSGDDRSTSPRSQGDRAAGAPAEGKPEESRSRAEGREGTTQGAQGSGTRPKAEHRGPEAPLAPKTGQNGGGQSPAHQSFKTLTRLPEAER